MISAFTKLAAIAILAVGTIGVCVGYESTSKIAELALMAIVVSILADIRGEP